jgi:hypothetical protein
MYAPLSSVTLVLYPKSFNLAKYPNLSRLPSTALRSRSPAHGFITNGRNPLNVNSTGTRPRPMAELLSSHFPPYIVTDCWDMTMSGISQPF